jgi:hypothetical protein
MDGDPTASAGNYTSAGCTPGGSSGQATRIANATGGKHVSGVAPADIVASIIDLVKAAFTIKNVKLVARGAIAQFVTSIEPGAGYGPLTPDKEHVLKFEVAFAGDAVDCKTRSQIFNGSLDVVADGATLARKPTVITVPPCQYVYAIKFVCGTAKQCDCGCGPVEAGSYATEINILNSGCRPATVETKIVPLVLSGAVLAREPKTSASRPGSRFTMPPGSATMTDCCRFTEQLLGAKSDQAQPLTIGWLQIVSSRELHVTAVYTSTGQNGCLSTSVEVISAKLH